MCPRKALTLFMLDCQYLIMPTLSADTSHSPFGLQVIARIAAPSCAYFQEMRHNTIK